ncbi:bifunctional metallophosphatase/5'-nucleotidase [Polaribacter sp.]|uniref:bifunctional metallophosphatase/5'-nucleotidase n=1 Tax=Polaribacter sp. TaxID=1920175 RepID=UPI003F6A6FA0
MKIIKNIAYILSIALFFSCNKNDDKIEFTFLQINDVYEIAPIQGGKFGGMARLETIHKDLIKENPNTMLFLAGDFLNPSLLGTIKVDGQRVRGKQMVEVMNAMNFDLVAFGNHEFDVSQKDLQQRLNESNFPWITANVKQKTAEKAIPFYKKRNGKKESVQETFVKEFSDADGTTIKVGFISVCIPSNPKDYVEYGNMFVKARASYVKIKDSVDVIFGLTHVKLANDKRIAKLIPDLPLIMGGHEHTNNYEKIGNTIIAKADANAKTAYIHRISFDKNTKKTVVKSELKEINETIKSDEEVGKIVNKWQNILTTKIKEIIPKPDEVIYATSIPLDGRDTPIRSIQTNLGAIITKSMSFSFNDKVDCALVNGGSIRIDDQLTGNITPIDIFRVLPYGGAVLKVKLKGRLLKRVLDYGKLAAGTGAYLQRFNAEKIGEQWFIKNQPLDIKKNYTVAFSDYLLKGFDIPFLNAENKEVISVYKPNENEMAIDIRKAVIEYLKNN